MSTPFAVRAERLVRHCRSRAGVVEAVRGVDLRVDAGEVFGFLGPNGAGMPSTLLSLTYVMEAIRSLLLRDLVWSAIWPGFVAVAPAGALMLTLDVRTIDHDD